MKYVPDTNILLRFAHRADPRHLEVLTAIRKIRAAGDEVQILPQTCVEFWNVCTRPADRNGFGLSVHQTDHSLRLIERIFPLLPDDSRVHQEWRKLVLRFGVSGVQVHDARIAAATIVHNITHILTFNITDFARYSRIGIVPVDPKNI